MTARKQAREAALAVWMQRYEDQVKAEPSEHSGVLADAASDVWETLLSDALKLIEKYAPIPCGKSTCTVCDDEHPILLRIKEALG